MKFSEMTNEELTELLHDAIEMQDISLYRRLKDELDKRTSLFE